MTNDLTALIEREKAHYADRCAQGDHRWHGYGACDGTRDTCPAIDVGQDCACDSR